MPHADFVHLRCHSAYSLSEGAIRPDKLAALARTTPMKRLAQPAEVAACIAWFASPENGYVTGQNIIIDGGMSRLRGV